MLSSIEKARAVARIAVEIFYEGLCTIKGFEPVKNPETFETEQKEIEYYKDIPCNLNIHAKPANQTETTANINYDAMLFMDPDVMVKAGCKIYVSQKGMEYMFQNVGEPVVFSTHQEIMLERIGRA
ncbi:hypothetical protein HNQ80_004837 [Anaerosolibacter carboniphilus]|uniref:Phage protein n=1 Tax=Anaerosolibacter carboniphilus TaxID=1417629 RepID=A0A841KZB7_9FIRM|nr:hypothetical protein [Anaerosolibacter carboniphilus]MBB6218663.1 hypothetical protein [Anaerosolibacter carboniphilus]